MDEKEARIQELQAEIFRLLRTMQQIESAANQQLEPLTRQKQAKVKELEALEASEVVA